MRQPNTDQTYYAAGVSLIEVLVALLLVSVTGFSVLAMSSFSTQESNSLRFEVKADYLGRSLLSRAQANANQDNQATYAFDNSTSTATIADDQCRNGCNSLTIAQVDIAEWATEAQLALPAVRYRSWWDNNNLRVAIAWAGPTLNNAALDCPFMTESNEGCRVYTASIPTAAVTE